MSERNRLGQSGIKRDCSCGREVSGNLGWHKHTTANPSHHEVDLRPPVEAGSFGDTRIPASFWNKVAVVGECWEWDGYRQASGHGRYHARRGEPLRSSAAHRYAYEALVGPVPEDLVLDHLCRNRPCVNPSHLEPVTQAVNVLRGISPAAVHAAKTHCKRGHEFTAENTYDNGNNQRGCRACRSLRTGAIK